MPQQLVEVPPRWFFRVPLADWQVGGVAWALLWAAELPPVVRGIPGIPHRPEGGLAAFPRPISET